MHTSKVILSMYKGTMYENSNISVFSSGQLLVIISKSVQGALIQYWENSASNFYILTYM